MALPDIAIPVLAFIQKLKSALRSKLLLGSGGVAAFTLILRYLFSKNTKYISDLSKVGRLLHSTAHNDNEEYDIIIVGGG